VTVTHVEFVSALPNLDCADCGETTVRDVVLVNQTGIVLLHGQTCTACGPLRHRPADDVQIPAPRIPA
jgi:hypothetical protein